MVQALKPECWQGLEPYAESRDKYVDYVEIDGQLYARVYAVVQVPKNPR